MAFLSKQPCIVLVPVQVEMEKAFPFKTMERTHEEATEALYAEEKVAILRSYLLEQFPISELSDNNGLQPTVFYRWQKEFFENSFGSRA